MNEIISRRKGGTNMNKKRTTLKIVLGVAVSLALSGITWAGDCGDTAGPGGTDVPCSCGDTVTTSTTLTVADPVVSAQDADFCPADGLIIQPATTARITLNLGGKSIRGSGLGVGIKIIGTDVKLTMRNGVVRSFETGFSTDAGSTADKLIVSKMTFTQNSGVGIDIVGREGEFNGNELLANGDSAIVLVGNDNDVLLNRVSHNGNNGLEISGDRSLLHKNNLAHNAGIGIQIEGAASTLTQNTVQTSGSHGVVLVGDGDANPGTLEIWKNKLVSNSGSGIIVEGDSYDISANIADKNGGDGILVLGTANVVGLNKVRENQANGLIVTGASPTDNNTDSGKNLGKKNVGVQCSIDGQNCTP